MPIAEFSFSAGNAERMMPSAVDWSIAPNTDCSLPVRR